MMRPFDSTRAIISKRRAINTNGRINECVREHKQDVEGNNVVRADMIRNAPPLLFIAILLLYLQMLARVEPKRLIIIKPE